MQPQKVFYAMVRTIASTQSLSAFVKSICDIMRRSNCASALQYVHELTWILFLRILDAQEARARDAAEAVGKPFTPALREPYRWRDWAAPAGAKRAALKTRVGDLFAFINKELLPYLHSLDVLPDGRPNSTATPKQRVIGRIMAAVEKVRVDSETNPPFGGKEGTDAQKNYSFETSSTQVLFLQHILTELNPALDGKPGGRCAIVLDEGLLFRTNESAFVETKRKLLDECDLWCILSLPGGVFTAAGAGVKTNLLFFTKGKKTERIWYYDLSHIKMGKKSPMTLAHFGWGPRFETLADDALPASLVGDWRAQEVNAGKPFPTFAHVLALRGTPDADSDFSWTVDFKARRAKAHEEMAPHRADIERLKNEAVALKEKIAALKKAKGSDDALADRRDKLAAIEKAAREAQTKTDTIDAVTFDLKAVNPRAKVERDTRSVADIMMCIGDRQREIDAAMQKLMALL